MARNHEKNFGRLNRLWLEKKLVKKEIRPKLSSLKTSNEISRWLPSIKQELDFFLKQIEVPCYSEDKIDDCRSHIMHLEAEYKAFVRKIHQLNSTLKATPWTSRPYEKRRKDNEKCLALHPVGKETQLTKINLLSTPVLEHDHMYQEYCGEEFKSDEIISMDESTAFQEIRGRIDVAEEALINNSTSINRYSRLPDALPIEETSLKATNTLGLDYSSSSSEEDV